jgi:hypothetical protein
MPNTEIPAPGIGTSDNRIKATRLIITRAEQAHRRRQDKLSAPYLNVSIELAKVVFREKLIPTFKVYLALKFADRSGIIRKYGAAKTAAGILGHKDTRTAAKGIRQAIALNWIGQDGRNLFIRGFHRLEKTFAVQTKKAGVLRETDLPNIREWIMGFNLADRNRHFSAVRKPARAFPVEKHVSKINGKTCSISILADEFKMSRAGACKLKQRAAEKGFYAYQNPVERTNINPAYLQEARKVLNDPGLFYEAGAVYRRLPSVFKFNTTEPGKLYLFHFTKRSNIMHKSEQH